MALEQIQRLLAKVFSKRSVKNLQVLPGGLINTNIRVEFEANYEPVVIRFYRNGAAVSAPGTDAGSGAFYTHTGSCCCCSET